MVHSLFAGLSKAEGANANDNKASSAATTTTECSAAAEAIANAERASNGSDGEICLFSSTEELLNGSDPHRRSPFQQQQLRGAYAIDGISGNSGQIGTVSRRQPRNTTTTTSPDAPSSIENGAFSFDSRPNNNSNATCFDYFNFHEDHSTQYNNNKQQPHSYNREHYSRQASFLSSLSAACCSCWPPANWSSASSRLINPKSKFQALSRQLGLHKMSLKRYYSLMLCLSLIIVSCLVASLVISRSVGADLEAEDSSSGRGADHVAMKLSSSPGKMPAATMQPEEAAKQQVEQRSIDLVDLIECGKTFAYTKYRLQVRVPKSSPIYEQRPAFLHAAATFDSNNIVSPTETGDESDDANGGDKNLGLHLHHHHDHHRFVLTSLQDPQEGGDGQGAEREAIAAIRSATIDEPSNMLEVAASEQRGNTGLWPPDSLQRGPPVSVNPLILDIRPTESRQTIAASDSAPGSLDGAAQWPAAWLAFVVGSSSSEGVSSDTKPTDSAPQLAEMPQPAKALEKKQEGQIAEASNPDVLLEPDDELDWLGPIEDAIVSMGLKSSNGAPKGSVVNRTLIDCFMVDTERRYGQKVALEDAYRQLANTRKVGFKKMMATVTECRLLTWSNAPHLIRGGSAAQATALPLALPVPPVLSSGAGMLGAASKLTGTPTPKADTTKVDLHEDFVRMDRDKEAAERAYQQEQQQRLLPQSFVGALLSNWLSPTIAPSIEQRALVDPAPGTATGGLQSPNALTGAESREQHLKQQRQQQQQQAQLPLQPALIGVGQPSGPDNLDRRRQGSYFNMGLSMISGIIPNTLWCGQGDRAANYSELGAEYLVDSCCRAHDHCPIRLKPFSTDYGLANWSMSTRSHCDCDLDFGQCLTAVNSTLSNVIKVLYFRFVGLQCIDVENRRQLGGGTVVATSTPASLAKP